MYISDARFSLWADFIERTFLEEGFRDLIARGVINGATSNPAIFKNAILTSDAYKGQLATLGHLSAKEKYEAVAIFDIQTAADILRPLFDLNDDGYVSLEVDPYLCDDTAGTIAEGRRLYAAINRPNVMIKVPATAAGYEAMEVLASEGIAVNATLIFSTEQALACAHAFSRAAQTSAQPVDTVISVFVSRIDRAVDEVLRSRAVATGLSGIYNAAEIYAKVGAIDVPKCRVLFASTGVKGDEYRPSYYIDELLAYNSVNTAPIGTIEAYVKGGDRSLKLPIDPLVMAEHAKQVAAAGVDLEKVIEEQISEGLEAFKVAFNEILSALE